MVSEVLLVIILLTDKFKVTDESHPLMLVKFAV